MKLGVRGWAGVALALLLCVAFLRFCVRIVPADEQAVDREISQIPLFADGPAGSLLLPVEGVSVGELTDTFTQARAQGTHPHDAIDIIAARGRAVLATADGRVEKLFWSEQGGRTIYERSRDGRWIYYYAHLDGYAPGLAEGQSVRRGQRIATVGSTGNADPSAPHLHFAVNAMAPGDPWHGGRAINPYPLLTGD